MPRPLLTGCTAMAIAVWALALGGPGVPAGAATTAAAQANGTPPVSLAITSVSPTYAKPNETVTVSGTLTNVSNRAMSGLSIQLRSSPDPFTSRGSLQEYADGTFPADEPVTGAVTTLKEPVPAQTTITWSVPLPVDDVGMTTFGVYPLAAQAENSSLTPLTVSRTFLPFWPNSKSLQPDTEAIAWIWPLIDQPRQGACSGLVNNGLEASLASGGRLDDLLRAGSEFSGSAHLTWAIDPALLANADTMTKPYTTGDGGCGGKTKPASQAAGSWLAQLKSATTGQPVFVTPYADADVAALTRSHMTADLAYAFTEGRSVATSLLNRNFTGSGATDSANMTRLAWPADGIANRTVLENLAANGISTVVLDSTTMPPSPQQDYTPSAQTTASDGTGTPMTVLLSDDTITQIIGTANSPSDSKATAFASSGLGFRSTLVSRFTCCSTWRAWPSRPLLSWALLCALGGWRVTLPEGSLTAARSPRLTGCSHGAVTVSESRSLGSPAGGSQRRGGATTTDRPMLGCSAAIIAVSARYRCSTANAVALESDGELAVPMIWVMVSSESSTVMGVPVPSEAVA